MNDPSFAPWRDEATRTGITSCLALPICDRNNAPFGVLTLYVTEQHGDWPRNPFIFDEEEKRLLAELATGLAHGITALRDRAERDNAVARERASEARLADLLAASPTILYAIELHKDAWRPIEISSNLPRLGTSKNPSPNWW